MRNKLFTVSIMAYLLLTACSNQLPSCDSKDTKNVVEEIINKRSYSVGRYVDLQNIEEEAFNKKAQLRACLATIVTTQITENIRYSIEWEDNDEKDSFYIEINP